MNETFIDLLNGNGFMTWCTAQSRTHCFSHLALKSHRRQRVLACPHKQWVDFLPPNTPRSGGDPTNIPACSARRKYILPALGHWRSARVMYEYRWTTWCSTAPGCHSLQYMTASTQSWSATRNVWPSLSRIGQSDVAVKLSRVPHRYFVFCGDSLLAGMVTDNAVKQVKSFLLLQTSRNAAVNSLNTPIRSTSFVNVRPWFEF